MDLGVCTAGGWQFQQRLGSVRGTSKGQVDRGSHDHGRGRVHERSLTPMLQDRCELQQEVEYATQRMGGALPANYIVGTDSNLLQKMAVQDAWHNTDHYLVLGCLRGAPLAKHSHYLANKKRFPLKPPKIREDSTVWEWRSKGEIPIHLGGNISAMYGSHLRPGALSKPGLRHTKAGTV